MIKVLTSDEAVRKVRSLFSVAEGTAVVGAPAINIGHILAATVGSNTSVRIYNSLLSLTDTVSLAFIDSGPDEVGSLYDPDLMLVVIRTDKKYRLTEYPGRVLMDPRVLLFHELGHAMQHLVLKNSDILTAATRTKGEAPELITKQLVTLPSRSFTKTTIKTWEESYHFDYHAEYNNLRLHEHPISRELGVPIRSRYTDIAEAV